MLSEASVEAAIHVVDREGETPMDQMMRMTATTFGTKASKEGVWQEDAQAEAVGVSVASEKLPHPTMNWTS
jgi:hypothetical protein